MRTRNRLDVLQRWTYENLCRGRQMKAPVSTNDLTQIVYKEPKAYIGFYPMNAGKDFNMPEDLATTPSILLLFNGGYGKNVPEQRFDRYNHIHRVQEYGQVLGITALFSIYEPGIRMPGFTESAEAEGHRGGADPTLISDGTMEGIFTLTDWMDEFMEKLLSVKTLPDSDLTLNEATLQYAPYKDQNFIVDKRPQYYGFVQADFYGHADQEYNNDIEKLLE